ncbi:MAG: response regulator transcription factor [Dorea sp.]|uniref:response regulator transcription factor n=1 Tax=Dorea sp. YH-dor226 TaxID=3151119 RepID=UPI00304771DF|nr:response regulator transcription factor [Dorea sp.]
MRIVIVDDDMLVSSALKTILEVNEDVQVEGMGSDGKEAIALYERYRPDVLLMDIRMKDMSGLDASREILKAYPQAKILLLTTFSDDEYIVKALKYGVKGYLLKQDYNSILPALQAVQTGQTVFGTEIISKLPGLLQEKKVYDWEAHEISEKELQVISLVAEGMSNREIAAELYLSEGTVRNYISNILEKLELRDRTQLAVYYLNAVR